MALVSQLGRFINGGPRLLAEAFEFLLFIQFLLILCYMHCILYIPSIASWCIVYIYTYYIYICSLHIVVSNMHFNSTKQERMIFRESYTVLVAFLETISHCLLIESQSCWCFKSNLVMIMLFFLVGHIPFFTSKSPSSVESHPFTGYICPFQDG